MSPGHGVLRDQWLVARRELVAMEGEEMADLEALGKALSGRRGRIEAAPPIDRRLERGGTGRGVRPRRRRPPVKVAEGLADGKG